jgi:peptidoglycan-associated lipoprotein
MGRFLFGLLAGVLVTGAVFAQSSAGQQSTTRQTSQHINITMTRSDAQPTPAEQQEVKQNLQDVHFAFDRYDLDGQARQILQENANWLKANPGVTVSIAANADERGDITYNLALTQKRAEAVREALVADGVPADRIQFATGWGKLYPICSQSDESCWAQNRRAHLTPGTMLQTETLAQQLRTLPIIACAQPHCP